MIVVAKLCASEQRAITFDDFQRVITKINGKWRLNLFLYELALLFGSILGILYIYIYIYIMPKVICDAKLTSLPLY